MLKFISIFFFILNILCLLMFCYYTFFYKVTDKDRLTFVNEKMLQYFVGFWAFLYLACIAEILRFHF